MYKYTSLIERFVLFLFFIYFVLSGAFEFLDVGSGIPLIGEYLNPNSFSIYNHINIAKYFVIYLLLIQYVMPNVVSYFSLTAALQIWESFEPKSTASDASKQSDVLVYEANN